MKYLLLLLPLFLAFGLEAQSASESDKVYTLKPGIQALGMTIHTFQSSRPDYYTLRLDENGYFVPTPGVVLFADWYFNEKQKMHLRGSVSWYRDSGFNHAGYAHLGLRHTFIRKGKWDITAGLGPAYFIRQNWNYIYPDRRRSDPFYGERETKNGLYQHRWFVGGEVDIIYRINSRLDIDFSIVPAVPAAIIFKGGLRYGLNLQKQ